LIERSSDVFKKPEDSSVYLRKFYSILMKRDESIGDSNRHFAHLYYNTLPIMFRMILGKRGRKIWIELWNLDLNIGARLGEMVLIAMIIRGDTNVTKLQ